MIEQIKAILIGRKPLSRTADLIKQLPVQWLQMLDVV